MQCTISKINYRLHTHAIKEHLVSKEIKKVQASIVYANEVRERLLQLNKIAITQMKSLLSNKSINNIHQ